METLGVLVDKHKNCLKRLNDFKSEIKTPLTSLNQRHIEVMRRSIEYHTKSIKEFGNGLPIFKIFYRKLDFTEVVEYFQCHDEDEAHAAFTLLRNCSTILSIEKIELRSPIEIL